MIALSVNLNKIALLRNSREGQYPSLLEFGRLALTAGADGLTIHPRPDQRHIRISDVEPLRNLAIEHGVEFNIEGNPFASAVFFENKKPDYPGFMSIVESAPPHQCTLVPDTSSQLTSDHGFDLQQDARRLEPIVKKFQDQNIRVSLFMDPDLKQIQLAKDIGVERIELYTGPYAEACKLGKEQTSKISLEKYWQASEFATQIGLGVNAGHDLNLNNLEQFATIPGLMEVSIGHALTVDGLRFGFAEAVKKYKKTLNP